MVSRVPAVVAALWLALAPSVGAGAAMAPSPAPAAPAIYGSPYGSPQAASTAESGIVSPASQLDINTATRQQLMSLVGIGPAYADRIIQGRPYARKNQLKDKGIVPKAEYEKIKNLIVARHVK